MVLLSDAAAVAAHALRDYWPYILLVLILARFTRNHYLLGLHDIPGPFLSSLTDLWHFFHCLFGRSWKDYELHRKYNSPLLRLGPNTISVSDAEAVRIIYGYKPVFKKSAFYTAQLQTNRKGDVIGNLSSTRDEEEHARLRRPVAHTYAMSSLVAYEPLIDSTFRQFSKEMDARFVGKGKECPLAKWLQMYAFDIIGELIFSTRLGFLETGSDIGNMMSLTSQLMNYSGIMGQLPMIDLYLRVKNPIIRKLVFSAPIIKFTTEQIHEHMMNPKHTSNPDFLTQFVKAREKYPDIMDEDRIAENARTAVAAGSDTTAIALRELVYQILTHPQTYDRFMQELKELLRNRPQDQDFDKPIRWTEGVKMTYFQACVKECLRCHPAVGQLMPREVPKGGVEICGRFLREGTVVGCNAWTVHRDKNLYGENADDFVPERWIDSDPEQIRKMENLYFAFGAGPRTCIGKNIAMLEITKFIPEFFRRYEVTLVDPRRYRSSPGFLVSQSGLDIILQKRDPESLV